MRRLGLLVGAIVIVVLGATWVKAATSHSSPTPVVDTRIVQLKHDLGLKPEALSGLDVQITDVACSLPYSPGCYYPSTHTIYISPTVFHGTPFRSPQSLLAYEYEHFVWQKLNPIQRGELTPLIATFYRQHRAALAGRVAGFVKYEGGEDSAAFTDELHSFICTEVNDAELPAPVLSHCNQTLPNRTILPRYF